MSEILYRGEDLQILVRLYQDEAKTVPINIDDLEDLEVRAFVGAADIGMWNKTGGGDFTALSRIDAYNYYFYISAGSTTPVGNIDLWFEAIEVDAELPDGFKNTISSGAGVICLKDKPY